jgi:hypothetical protein
MRRESIAFPAPIAYQSAVISQRVPSPTKPRLSSPKKVGHHPTSSGERDVLKDMFAWLNQVPKLYDETSRRLPIAHEAECVSEDEDEDMEL